MVGIIAILIGILLPALSKVQEQSRRTNCLANLRTIGQAMFVYANDHHDLLPNDGMFGSWTYDPDAAIIHFANKYVRNPGALHCPSDREEIPKSIDNYEYNEINSAHVSYEYYSIWWPPEFGPRLTKMRGKAPLAWDMDGNDPTSTNRNHKPMGGNVLYADGRAEWQDGKLWDDTWWPNPAVQFYVEP